MVPTGKAIEESVEFAYEVYNRVFGKISKLLGSEVLLHFELERQSEGTMISEFTEFSYGFSLTQELMQSGGASGYWAPYFPSLIKEGKAGGGYDVRIDRGRFLYLQFKLSEYMVGGPRGAGQEDVIALPYYRFWVTPRWLSKQHKMLVGLDQKGAEVYYAAPIFHTEDSLNSAFNSRTVANNSAFFSPADIGYLQDDEWHCMVFRSDVPPGYFCSEPRETRRHTWEGLKEKMHRTEPCLISEMATWLKELLNENQVNGLDSLLSVQVPEEEPLHSLAFIARASRLSLHAEVFFMPELKEA